MHIAHNIECRTIWWRRLVMKVILQWGRCTLNCELYSRWCFHSPYQMCVCGVRARSNCIYVALSERASEWMSIAGQHKIHAALDGCCILLCVCVCVCTDPCTFLLHTHIIISVWYALACFYVVCAFPSYKIFLTVFLWHNELEPKLQFLLHPHACTAFSAHTETGDERKCLCGWMVLWQNYVIRCRIFTVLWFRWQFKCSNKHDTVWLSLSLCVYYARNRQHSYNHRHTSAIHQWYGNTIHIRMQTHAHISEPRTVYTHRVLL